ncbi:MAG TPA: ribonuclease HII [Nitrospinaceae bacterium]|nr:ribonuclease HII [Nitrospinaceae bacterium]HBP10309.1 ribonuclease HII [Nitrospina sp.]HCK68674.1 ribonuclease HII [Nitrospina sp.]HIE80517.1 ribonuclease HII [Nitrospinaceae bacterium]
MQRDLWDYEIKAGKKGYRLIAGVDEAGRGPLAGPVVAAAVVLPADAILQGLDDSKKLSPTRREELFPKIQTQAVVYGVAVVNPEVIDKINILQAALLAMQQAVEQLQPVPDLLLIDGNQKTASSIEQWAIVKGDSKSLSIAAASVLAKVTRDHIMQDYHQLYPQYEFARHKGYGTKLHRDLIAEHGPCPIHRSTFKGVTEYLNR